MEAENVTSQPVMVRRIRSGAMAKGKKRLSQKRRMWRRAAMVAAAGALFGFAASIWLETPAQSRTATRVEGSTPQQTSVIIVPAESAPAKSMVDNSAEIERLQTRNRRLEALVEVLQKRTQMEKRNPDLKIKN